MSRPPVLTCFGASFASYVSNQTPPPPPGEGPARAHEGTRACVVVLCLAFETWGVGFHIAFSLAPFFRVGIAAKRRNLQSEGQNIPKSSLNFSSILFSSFWLVLLLAPCLPLLALVLPLLHSLSYTLSDVPPHVLFHSRECACERPTLFPFCSPGSLFLLF